jgi:hypothetical protein
MLETAGRDRGFQPAAGALKVNMRRLGIEGVQNIRGTATVEAVVVLPVFVVLLVGISFVRDATSTRLFADQDARRCAWQYSFNNCESVPPGCEQVLAIGHLGVVPPKVENLLSNPKTGVSGGVRAILDGIVKTTLLEAFTKSLDANRVVERDRPWLFGGSKSRITGKYRLACNVATQVEDGFLGTLWNQLRQ